MPFRLISGAWRTQAPEQFPQGGLARRAKARGELLGVARSRARTGPSSAAGCGPIDPLPPPVAPGRCPQAARGRRRSRGPRPASRALPAWLDLSPLPAVRSQRLARPDSRRRPSWQAGKKYVFLFARPCVAAEGTNVSYRDIQVISTRATQYLRSTTALRHSFQVEDSRVSGP